MCHSVIWAFSLPTDLPDGQSYKNLVNCFTQKYFASVFQKIMIISVHPASIGGPYASSRTSGGRRWTFAASTDEGCRPADEQKRVVLIPRCRDQASRGTFRGMRRWLQKPGHRGEHAISRKPLRREGWNAPVEPVVIFLRICHGCNQHPAFPAPSDFRGYAV